MKKSIIKFLAILMITAFALSICPINAYAKSYPEPVKSFLRDCSLYKPVRYRNLTIIPVRAPEGYNNHIITLDQAIKNEDLTIKEVNESGSVNTLAVWNHSDSDYVFIMSGEILAGSKQDRILKKDVLIPPNSSKIMVDAYCVEHGRWTYKSEKFYSEERNANISVRQTAQCEKSQSGVWDNVASTNRDLKASAPTGSLSESYKAPIVKEKKEQYTKMFIDIPSQYPRANGVIVMINGRVLAADLFSNRAIFKKLWKKLMDSYAMEAMKSSTSVNSSNFTSARSFLDALEYATVSYSSSPGAGRFFEIESNTVSGSGILNGSSPIHLAAFPKIKFIEKNIPEERPLQRNYNQQEQQIPYR